MDKDGIQLTFLEEHKASSSDGIEPTFISGTDDLEGSKKTIIEKEKEAALQKVASFSGRVQDPYPSPFLNLSDTKIPRTTVEIFRWCKYYFMFDPLISGAINALSAFPVSEIYLEDKNSKEDEDESDTLKTYKRVLFKNLDIYTLLIEIGIDYWLYGNCFVFGEKHTNPVTGEIEWKHMLRLDPNKVTIDYNPATNTSKYKWQVPQRIQEIIRKKKPRDEYDKIPDAIKRAARKGKALVLNPDNIYHFKRPTDSSGNNSVWGTPVIANVMKLLMYRNVLRQAQEAIAREHIVPMRVYYLDKTDSYNPQGDWNNVAGNFAAELQKAVKDPNHKVVAPVPVNVINVGGEGKNLLLTPEIEQIQSEILAGMNVPREFIFGGVSYSGSSISLKILENQFITYRLLLKDFIQNFIIKGMAKSRKEWVTEQDDDLLITVKFQDLKMQDDVQQKQLIIQLNSQGKCSDDYMWKTLGIDSEKMREAIEKEKFAQLEQEHKLNVKKMELKEQAMDAQMKLQQKQIQMNAALQNFQGSLGVGDPEEPEQPNDTQQSGESLPQSQQEEAPQENGKQQQENEGDELDAEINNLAKQIANLPNKKYRAEVISKLPENSKEKVMRLVEKFIQEKDIKESNPIDMRPMPQQRPPRRNSLK